MSLSKSRYTSGIQCPKILWMNEHKSDVAVDVSNQQVFDTGNMVGDIAMGYYGDYTEVPYNEDKQIMIAETRRLLNAKTKVICEASFSYESNFCSVDILRVFENHAAKSSYEFVEVKSSTEIKKSNYDDMAFQYYVLTSCGLNVSRVSLMHINNAYVRQGDVDLKGLFTVNDCTEKVRSMQGDIAANIKRICDCVAEKSEPVIDIGEYCEKPYLCAYKNYCWRHIPEYSVFDIKGKSPIFKEKISLYRRGIVSFKQLLDSGEKLNKNARQQVEMQVFERPPAVNKKAVRAFIDSLSWPLYFFDFESFREAVPPYNGLRPYMQTPFQYSLHIQQSPGGIPLHREFLAEPGTDPRRIIAERLCADIPKNACVVTYNMVFEKMCIKDLAHFLKGDLAEHLMSIHGNIKDLMKIFELRAYYSRELKGSYSIKNVLPALCPDDPELDYKTLGLVKMGTDAQAIYSELLGKPHEEQQRLRDALLAYCRLDTLAMVKILDKLMEISE